MNFGEGQELTLRSVRWMREFPTDFIRTLAHTGGCKYVKTRIEDPGGKGLYPQIAETGE